MGPGPGAAGRAHTACRGPLIGRCSIGPRRSIGGTTVVDGRRPCREPLPAEPIEASKTGVRHCVRTRRARQFPVLRAGPGVDQWCHIGAPSTGSGMPGPWIDAPGSAFLSEEAIQALAFDCTRYRRERAHDFLFIFFPARTARGHQCV